MERTTRELLADRPSWRRGGTPAAAACLVILLGGCREVPPAPVARLAVAPPEVVLAYPGSAGLPAEWAMIEPLPAAGEPWVFVHLLDASGALVRTFDHPLPFPWRAGETRSAPLQLWQSALAPPLPPGDYRLTVGLYDVGSGRRWALETGVPEVARQEYEVARVRVEAEEGAGPGLAFGGSWGPAEEGSDLQVLARRWLFQEGSLDLSGLAGPVRVELGLLLPEEGEGARKVLLEGAEGAVLRVSSPCATEEAVVEPPGPHTVRLDLHPGDDGRCTLGLEPSFVFVDMQTLARRAAALERLTVSPAPRSPPLDGDP